MKKPGAGPLFLWAAADPTGLSPEPRTLDGAMIR